MFVNLRRYFCSIRSSLINKLTIYDSRSQCIYENLAYEEWIFRNHNFEKNGDVILLWSNTPAVVIGRHQNPWLEANIRYCEENGIKIARRHSGGGAVFHDLGNLNISILSHKNRHCRKSNLKLLSTYLNDCQHYVSKINPTQRDDLVFEENGCKISGTAARISHGRAYHHFTLLVCPNMHNLRNSLRSTLKDKIETNATVSNPAKSVGCLLQKICYNVNSCEDLMSQVKCFVMEAFKSRYEQMAHLELKGPSVRVSVDNTEDERYPGLIKELRRLRSEEWIYGYTPQFKLKICSSSMGSFYEIVVNSGRIKESLHKSFPVGDLFNHALLRSKFV